MSESARAPAAPAPPASATASVLAAADIPPPRLGACRTSRLTAPERAAYTWILHRFATFGRPGVAELRAHARGLGLDAGRTLEKLAREDLVHLGADGEIAVAYPFSGRPTAHRVRFPHGPDAYAMCALDALGVAPMFAEPVEIASRDPLRGEEIMVRVAPNVQAEWSPPAAVLVAGALQREAASCAACCPVLNFFASPASAENWLAQRPQVRGEAVSIRDAIVAGAAVFGDVLRED